MKYLRTLRAFGPGLVLAGGALVLELLPDHSAQNTFCAENGSDPSTYPSCPLPADRHPTEILLFAVAGAVGLLVASLLTWRRLRKVPMGNLTHRIQAGIQHRITILVWLIGSVAVYAGVFALTRLFVGPAEVDPYGMYAGESGPDSSRGSRDEWRQIWEDRVFATAVWTIVTALLVLLWAYALRQSRRRSARYAAMRDPEPSPPPA